MQHLPHGRGRKEGDRGRHLRCLPEVGGLQRRGRRLRRRRRLHWRRHQCPLLPPPGVGWLLGSRDRREGRRDRGRHRVRHLRLRGWRCQGGSTKCRPRRRVPTRSCWCCRLGRTRPAEPRPGAATCRRGRPLPLPAPTTLPRTRHPRRRRMPRPRLRLARRRRCAPALVRLQLQRPRQRVPSADASGRRRANPGGVPLVGRRVRVKLVGAPPLTCLLPAVPAWWRKRRRPRP